MIFHDLPAKCMFFVWVSLKEREMSGSRRETRRPGDIAQNREAPYETEKINTGVL